MRILSFSRRKINEGQVGFSSVKQDLRLTFPAFYVTMNAMKKYQYILFDLDGTLVYSHPGIFSCFRYALQKMGREIPSDEALLPVIGPSLFYSFTTFFKMTEEDARRAVALYREQYALTGTWENRPVEGALDCLRALKNAGYKMALATSKPIIPAEKIVENHGFTPYFETLVGSGFDGSLPTKASVIEEAMKRLGASAKQCLMVGDRRYDAEGAAATGVDCALLKIGGYASEEELYSCKAKFLLEDFSQLEKMLTE